MTNIKTSVVKNILTIEIDLSQDHGPSNSSKTTIVATTGGNITIPFEGKEIKLGVNCYKSKKG